MEYLMQKAMKKFVLAIGIPVVAMFFLATGAEAKYHHRHGKMMMVEILHSKQMHMKKGMAKVFLVNMNGHKMIAIPAEMAPDDLTKGLYDYGQ